MNEPVHELEVYFAGYANEEQFWLIEAWIKADPANAKAFIDQLQFREIIGQHLRERADQSGLALAELARLEGQADAMTVTMHDTSGWGQDSPSVEAWRGAASYLIRHTFTPRRIAVLASAAVILLTAVLAVVLMVGPEHPQQVAEDMEQHAPAAADPPMTAPKVVATLTNELDAVWNRRPGDDLYAGQRLTLTRGFAEITTGKGAVAILEAPATVEMLDSNNALYLHAGKLVGICETQGSKGFQVRTPHLVVTDLGTRFGVSSQPDAIISTVFSGVIRLTDTAGSNRDLHTDQTATLRVDKKDQSIVIKQSASESFHQLLSNPLVDPFAPYRPRFDGDAVAWRGMIPHDIRSQRNTADRPLVYVEREPFTLTSEVQVDLTPEHTRFTHKPLEGVETSVPSGARVKVYLIHFDSRGGESVRGDYTLRFDGPILGVIASGQRLIETDATLGNSAVQYPEELFADKTNRGLDPDGLDPDDAEVDGQSLRLSFGVSNYLDQVRVIVQAEPNPAD